MLDHVVRLQPRRVLDIGPGYGKWGFLVREALDFMPGRLDPDDWTVEINGVDSFQYNSALLDWIYDSVIVQSALDVINDLRGYDLVILGDVIEHLTKDDGMQLLDSLLKTNCNVLIATPLDFFEQEIGNNPSEQHLSVWSQEDFQEWNYDYDVVGGSVLVILVAGVGAIWPTRNHAVASRWAYMLPGLARRGTVAGMVKKVILYGPDWFGRKFRRR